MIQNNCRENQIHAKSSVNIGTTPEATRWLCFVSQKQKPFYDRGPHGRRRCCYYTNHDRQIYATHGGSGTAPQRENVHAPCASTWTKPTHPPLRAKLNQPNQSTHQPVTPGSSASAIELTPSTCLKGYISQLQLGRGRNCETMFGACPSKFALNLFVFFTHDRVTRSKAQANGVTSGTKAAATAEASERSDVSSERSTPCRRSACFCQARGAEGDAVGRRGFILALLWFFWGGTERRGRNHERPRNVGREQGNVGGKRGDVGSERSDCLRKHAERVAPPLSSHLSGLPCRARRGMYTTTCFFVFLFLA